MKPRADQTLRIIAIDPIQWISSVAGASGFSSSKMVTNYKLHSHQRLSPKLIRECTQETNAKERQHFVNRLNLATEGNGLGAWACFCIAVDDLTNKELDVDRVETQGHEIHPAVEDSPID